MPPRFRQFKILLRQWLVATQTHRNEIDALPAASLANALLACLPQPELRDAAASELGRAVDRLAETSPEGFETARIFVRRLMWHMNEESGNIGWGIPEAFGAILCANTRLAREFHRILCSYVMQTGRNDNYCDHDILRRSCYAAVGAVGLARPEYAPLIRPLLEAGQHDADAGCREVAAAWLQKIEPMGVQGHHPTGCHAPAGELLGRSPSRVD